MRVFALVMSAVYILCGCGLLFTNALRTTIPHYRTGLGVLLVGYGAVRVVLWYMKRPPRAAQ